MNLTIQYSYLTTTCATRANSCVALFVDLIDVDVVVLFATAAATTTRLIGSCSLVAAEGQYKLRQNTMPMQTIKLVAPNKAS